MAVLEDTAALEDAVVCSQFSEAMDCDEVVELSPLGKAKAKAPLKASATTEMLERIVEVVSSSITGETSESQEIVIAKDLGREELD